MTPSMRSSISEFNYPERMTCVNNEDCRVIESACSGWQVVNSKYADAIQSENIRKKPSANNCPLPREVTPKPNPACVEDFCAPDNQDCSTLDSLYRLVTLGYIT